MAITTFQDMILRLESYGMIDVLLPFLLIFTITFAVLQKSNILGDNRRPFNKIIAFVLAMAVIIPHVLNRYPPQADVVDIINKALPNISLFMVVGMMVLLLIGVFGQNIKIAGTGLEPVVVLLSIVAVALVFMGSAGWLGRHPPWLDWLFTEETGSLLVTLLIFGLIIWFITREEKPEETKDKSWLDMFKGVMGEK